MHAGAVTVLENEDERKARLVMEVNVGGTFNLLETSIGAGVKRFIYVSSSGVYGSRGGGVVPLHETTPMTRWAYTLQQKSTVNYYVGGSTSLGIFALQLLELDHHTLLGNGRQERATRCQ